MSVVLSVAWVFVTVFAFVTINNHNNMIKNIQYIKVAQIEPLVVEEVNEEIEIIEPLEAKVQVTSRSGLNVNREENKIFYEEINFYYFYFICNYQK